MHRVFLSAVSAAALAIGACAAPALAQTSVPPAHITSPKEAMGHDIGEDYFLANYTQLEAYWKTLAKESDRARLVDIGKTGEGRTQYMMIVSSPENLKNLDKYKDISHQLAQAKGLTDAQAHVLAKTGKAVVWIDGGMHAAESEHAQALIQGVYDILSANDEETRRILDDVIILYGQDNPDGQELVADWYMRFPNPKDRPFYISTGGGLPRLYNKYIGHDNNRDWYAVTQPETENVSRVLFREWFPQIIYNHHQPGPTGGIVFVPPFRDPFNYHYDPLVMTELSEVGAAMHSRLVSEDKPGSSMRSASTYSTWFNGSERTVSYFHNAIGLLTEIQGNPTPFMLPLVPENQLPHNDVPYPVAPQMWHLKQSIDYSVSLNRAVLDYASRNREKMLYGFYEMGRNAIARGGRDSWTVTPKDIEALKVAAKSGDPARRGLDAQDQLAGIDVSLYEKVLHDPAKRDARGYVIPADQADFPTAVTFANALIKSGVTVDKATAPFSAGGRSYPAGSLVVMADQAYRPHLQDMFEPQDHPQDFEYPGGPPVPPYDATGYTLAFQMGIKFDRILEGFTGPFQPVPDVMAPPAGRIVGAGKAGWVLDHAVNNTFLVTNRLLKAGVAAYWLKSPVQAGGASFGPGALWVPASPKAQAILATAADKLGVSAYALDARPAGEEIRLKPLRIGLVDLWSGNMPSGWTRWMFDQFEFPYTVVRPQRLDAGGLNKDFDVIVFQDATYVGAAGAGKNARAQQQPKAEDIPAQYRAWLGTVTDDKTVPQLAAFAKAGGTVIAIGSATAMADPLGLPVKNALVADGKPLSRSKFYVPGSLVTVQVDPTDPIAYGMPATVDMFYDNNPVFQLADGAKGVRKAAWFAPSGDVLHSGWAWNQKTLNGTTAVVDAEVGKGKVYLMGPEIAQRGQSQATYKLLFNGLLFSGGA